VRHMEVHSTLHRQNDFNLDQGPGILIDIATGDKARQGRTSLEGSFQGITRLDNVHTHVLLRASGFG
jgi:hypothetical protein